ncbi:MAG: hypothetical protein JWP88_1634 [Flaviaesturariibacter sp.]|nr:hypothetical protein [Flaviaesturariibacter sp.]
MKELFVSYAGFNGWANGLLLGVINSLPPEKQQQEVTSSFSSLHKTVLHMLDAESIWWQRLKLQEQIIRPSDNFSGNMLQLTALVQKQDRQWQEWISGTTEAMLQHQFIYQNTKKETFKQPIFQMLLHLFNHNTYHRGQLVTMLRQLGVQKLPGTDYIEWARKRPLSPGGGT